LKIHGDANVADMKAKIRALKIELQDLNDQFQRTVDKTKRQNDENHKIYEQDALINRLKVKIEKKTIRARANYENLRKVLSKTEIFKYGYTKTFNDSNLGIMCRKVVNNKKSKSLIRDKDNNGIDYSIKDLSWKNLYNQTKEKFNYVPDANYRRKKILKKYRSVSRAKSGKLRFEVAGKKSRK
jgi:hypothetical protein